MDSRIYSKELISILRDHRRSHRSLAKRPIFVFCCGGNREDHPARSELVRYVESSKRDELKNVFFIVAENIDDSHVFGDLDLLTQEAVIADVSDSLILFAESVGSFCELGAFAALQHIRSILTVGVDKHHTSNQSFLMKGPVSVVAKMGYPLNKVFPLNLNCPMDSPEFSAFVNGIRGTVKQSESKKINRNRKKLNNSKGDIKVGALVHELLDLVHLFGPVSKEDLIDLYCKTLGLQKNRVKIISLTLELDMKSRYGPISFDQVIDFMEAVGIVCSVGKDEEKQYFTDLKLEDYFLFKSTENSDFTKAIAKVAIAKRHRRREGYGNVYRRFDIW